MRTFGRTISKIADLLIGAYCVENSHDLLHSDSAYGALLCAPQFRSRLPINASLKWHAACSRAYTAK